MSSSDRCHRSGRSFGADGVLTRFMGLPRYIAAACALVACMPDTELQGEGGTPADMSNGSVAAASLINPTPGDGAVPVNLAAILVRFSAAVSLGADVLPPGAMTISSGGRTVVAEPALTVECPPATAGTCFRSLLSERLAPSTTYLVSLSAGVVDATGRPLAAGTVGQFITGAEADSKPPTISGLAVVPSGPCVVVSFQTDEPAAGTLLIRGDDGSEKSVGAGAGTTTFSVASSLLTFGGGSDIQVVARGVDLAGNVAETAAVSLTVPLGLLSLAITEVLANSAGPEPAQEYVEIRNLGAQAVGLTGIAIEDGKGSDPLPAVLLEPGAYALVVPLAFDPLSITDTPPRPGTALLRVDARIGADGLSNGGEVVRLRRTIAGGSDGAVLTSYGGFVDVSTTKWAGKGVHRVPQDACDQKASWTQLPSEATPGWAPP